MSPGPEFYFWTLGFQVVQDPFRTSQPYLFPRTVSLLPLTCLPSSSTLFPPVSIFRVRIRDSNVRACVVCVCVCTRMRPYQLAHTWTRSVFERGTNGRRSVLDRDRGIVRIVPRVSRLGRSLLQQELSWFLDGWRS